jgi:hypothetical protein
MAREYTFHDLRHTAASDDGLLVLAALGAGIELASRYRTRQVGRGPKCQQNGLCG